MVVVVVAWIWQNDNAKTHEKYKKHLVHNYMTHTTVVCTVHSYIIQLEILQQMWSSWKAHTVHILVTRIHQTAVLFHIPRSESSPTPELSYPNWLQAYCPNIKLLQKVHGLENTLTRDDNNQFSNIFLLWLCTMTLTFNLTYQHVKYPGQRSLTGNWKAITWTHTHAVDQLHYLDH